MHPRALPLARTCTLPLLALLAGPACSRGDFSGEVTNPDTAPAAKNLSPAPTHERVAFTWRSSNDSFSGHLQTTLPTGETFSGQYHEITTQVPVDRFNEVYGGWYAGPWAGPRWTWGDAWPYYDTVEDFVTHYTGRVVARLKGDRGNEMRCHFRLSDRYGGMKAGGTGECQVSTGERITANFEPS